MWWWRPVQSNREVKVTFYSIFGIRSITHTPAPNIFIDATVQCMHTLQHNSIMYALHGIINHALFTTIKQCPLSLAKVESFPPLLVRPVSKRMNSPFNPEASKTWREKKTTTDDIFADIKREEARTVRWKLFCFEREVLLVSFLTCRLCKLVQLNHILLVPGSNSCLSPQSRFI